MFSKKHMIFENNIHWYMEINNIQIYLPLLLLNLHVALKIGKCTPRGTCTHVRDEVRCKNKFGAPLVEPELFRKQIYCIEESTCEIVGTFRRLPQ